jgi:hypothetical protein
MIRNVMISLALSAALIYIVLRLAAIFEAAAPAPVTRIDIYGDRITYRTNRYLSPSLLAIGLQTVNDPPRLLALHVCGRMEDFAAVVQILRDQGYSSFDVELPDDC